MQIRTDLVSERQELHTHRIDGADTTEENFGTVDYERVCIRTDAAAAALGKPCGTYLTLGFGTIMPAGDCEELCAALQKAFTELLGDYRHILIAGLGNRDITPDAIGPRTADGIFATRHLDAQTAAGIGLKELRPVSVLIPGVVGKTGIESGELIAAAVRRCHPDAVLVIDALAAHSPTRLCRTVQLCDTGICPGSGVQNKRQEISAATIGVPVVALGIPTVVDVASYLADFGATAPGDSRFFMITPKDIDEQILHLAALLADALNRFLQPQLSPELLRQFV